MRGEVAECGAVDDGGDHLGGGSGCAEGGVVIAHWDGGDLRISRGVGLGERVREVEEEEGIHIEQ